ncbi:MAG: hypothetical protein F6J97_11725 [Leptolyngbya sp. SIO4C1]|nr:hypothetical protein [Leptolyngbya sp. SIO4C1]
MTSDTRTLTQTFDRWLTQQIEELSVDTLKEDTVTCTACGKVTGEYIIEYRGQTFRYPAGKAYAFLMFIAQSEGSSL